MSPLLVQQQQDPASDSSWAIGLLSADYRHQGDFCPLSAIALLKFESSGVSPTMECLCQNVLGGPPAAPFTGLEVWRFLFPSPLAGGVEFSMTALSLNKLHLSPFLLPLNGPWAKSHSTGFLSYHLSVLQREQRSRGEGLSSASLRPHLFWRN